MKLAIKTTFACSIQVFLLNCFILERRFCNRKEKEENVKQCLWTSHVKVSRAAFIGRQIMIISYSGNEVKEHCCYCCWCREEKRCITYSWETILPKKIINVVVLCCLNRCLSCEMACIFSESRSVWLWISLLFKWQLQRNTIAIYLLTISSKQMLMSRNNDAQNGKDRGKEIFKDNLQVMTHHEGIDFLRVDRVVVTHFWIACCVSTFNEKETYHGRIMSCCLEYSFSNDDVDNNPFT